MKTRNTQSAVALLALCAGVALAATTTTARAAVVVAPNSLTNAMGNGQGMGFLRGYGAGGKRYQQVYTSANFGGFTASESISKIAFRAKQALFGTFIGNSVTVSNIIITMSTTSKNDVTTLDPTFANNTGSNAMVVYSGSLTLTTATAGTTAFGYVINLQSGFVFNKGDGNLLLDFVIPDNAIVSGNGTIGFSQFDTITDAFPSGDGIGSATGASGSATIGSNSTTGLVTQFTSTAVPTPGAAALLALGGVVLGRRRR
jgi:uncharacterized protein (TIGR03382 family)